MREILFRGKRLDNVEWAYGYFCEFANNRTGEQEIYIQTVKKDGRIDLLHKVDPATVGQFTGLTDKNGKRIFEGDIVRVERWLYSGENKKEREVFNGVVWYGEKHTCFGLRSTKYRCLPIARFKGDYSTVVGNIHDNPELIGERKDNG